MRSTIITKNENILICPKCKQENLHQTRMKIFDRLYENGTNVVTLIDSPKIITDTNIKGQNPSPRQNGMLIYFNCENCIGESGELPLALAIYQHKGSTYLEWYKVADSN